MSGAMIALFWLFLAVSVSPQVKEPTCGRERGAPTSIDCAAADGARSRSTHEWGSLVLGPVVSMVPIGPQGHHDHPARDSRALASGRLPSVLAVEIPLPWRPVVPENSIQLDSHGEAESLHHPMRCLRSSACLQRMSPIYSSRGADLRPRTSSSVISSTSH